MRRPHHARVTSTSEQGAPPRWLPAAPAVFLVLWSGGFAVAKVGVGDAAPMTFLALRYGLVVALLLPLVPILRPAFPTTRRAWLDLVIVGLLIQALYFGLSYVSLDAGISAGALALIVSLQPVLVGLLVPHLAGEHVGRVRWAGLLLGLAGAGLVIAGRSSVEATSVIAIACAAGALAAMTSGTLYEKRFGIEHHPVTANLVQCAVGLAATLPIALLHEGFRASWSPGLAGALAYLVVGNSIISLTLLLAMIRHGEASRVSALFFLVPPVAAVIAWALLGERMPPVAWLGMAIAAVGVLIATRPQQRP